MKNKKRSIIYSYSFLLITLVVSVSALPGDQDVDIVFSYPINYSNIVINETSNMTENWNTNIGILSGVNSSQFSNEGGVLTALKSWWDGLYCQLTGCTMSGDIDMNGNDITMGNGNITEANCIELSGHTYCDFETTYYNKTDCSCDDGDIKPTTNTTNGLNCWFIANGSLGTIDLRGKFLTGQNVSDSAINTIGETGGVLDHYHFVTGSGGGGGTTGTPSGTPTNAQAYSSGTPVVVTPSAHTHGFSFGFGYGTESQAQELTVMGGGGSGTDMRPPYYTVVYKECVR